MYSIDLNRNETMTVKLAAPSGFGAKPITLNLGDPESIKLTTDNLNPWGVKVMTTSLPGSFGSGAGVLLHIKL